MLHAYAVRFDLTRNLKKIIKFLVKLRPSLALFRCSQTTKTFGEISTFWKNRSKQKLVKLGCKDFEFGILEAQNYINLLKDPCLVCCRPKNLVSI
jgi:hypothetical protein